MTYSEYIYHTTTSPGYHNTIETQENEPESNFIKTIESFKEERNKYKEIQENVIIQKINKTGQELKMKIDLRFWNLCFVLSHYTLDKF